MRRNQKYRFIKDEDYLIILSNRDGDGIGKPKTDYFLTIDVARELSMVENNERGRQVRKYFIECEKRLKANNCTIGARDAEKLRQKARRLAIMERNARNRQAWILKSTAELFKAILSDAAMRAIAGEITLLLAGERLVELGESETKKPETEKLYSASEVGEMCGINANAVGRIANEHGLKTEEYGNFVPGESSNGAKQAYTFQYRLNAADKIKEILDSTAEKRVEEQTPQKTAKT
jgi:phage anti-repressor protein